MSSNYSFRYHETLLNQYTFNKIYLLIELNFEINFIKSELPRIPLVMKACND